MANMLFNAQDPIVFGLSFLELEPKHFECRKIDSVSGAEQWQPCTKEEICGNGLSKDEYRPVKDDPEYIDNWVEKYDMLCVDKYKVGLLGSLYFAGVVTSVLFVPALADVLGRKWILISSLALTSFAQAGLMWTNNLYEAYVYQYLTGLSFAGRVIVALNYILEYFGRSWHDLIIFVLMVSEAIGTILMTVWYQFIDHSWFALQLICLLDSIATVILFATLVPESPKWLYANQRYDEARENLAYVARFNSRSDKSVERIERLKFDLETLERLKQEKEHELSAASQREKDEISSEIAKRRDFLTQGQYIGNIVVMTIFWTVSSFSFYLTQSMNKYYEGSIFINYYLDGTAGVLGSTIALFTYNCFRMRWSFVFSTSLTLLGTIGLLIFQQGYVGAAWFAVFVPEKSPFPEGSQQEQDYYLGYLIPTVVFFAKTGINITFQNTYQASFSDNMIFPFYKRSTAIGICNLIARTFTILSALAAELPRPWPAALLIFLTVLSLVNSFFLPSYAAEEEFERKQAELANQSKEQGKEQFSAKEE